MGGGGGGRETLEERGMRLKGEHGMKRDQTLSAKRGRDKVRDGLKRDMRVWRCCRTVSPKSCVCVCVCVSGSAI